MIAARVVIGALVAGAFLSGTVLAKEPARQKTGPAPGTQSQMKGAEKMELPPPAAELEQLKIFAGRWSCGGSVPATELGPAREYRASALVEPIADGHWQSVKYEEEPSASNPMAMKVQGIWGWDPVSGQFVRTLVDNGGGYERNVTARGWEGDKLVWRGESVMMGQILPFRHTFTRSGDRQMSESMEIQKEGRWISLGGGNCTKATAAARRPMER